MKKLVATAPRVAELKDYEDREIKSNEVKVKVEFRHCGSYDIIIP